MWQLGRIPVDRLLSEQFVHKLANLVVIFLKLHSFILTSDALMVLETFTAC